MQTYESKWCSKKFDLRLSIRYNSSILDEFGNDAVVFRGEIEAVNYYYTWKSSPEVSVITSLVTKTICRCL